MPKTTTTQTPVRILPCAIPACMNEAEYPKKIGDLYLCEEHKDLTEEEVFDMAWPRIEGKPDF